ncbi:MAG TPA: HAMP domain-containing sensor histidine kinase [Planctomycetota bacterium]|nr:HAMP domain-containing sensor histidine kinase [Planctomycetota bacterium]
MERLNSLKITFVFIITIIIPSVFLSAFAYQAIEGERLARKKERDRHLNAMALLFTREVEEGVAAPARAFREACARAADRGTRTRDLVAAVFEARDRTLHDAASVDTLSTLVLYAPDGQRLYPATTRPSRATDTVFALNEARNIARIGSREAAIALLGKIEKDKDEATSLAAKLEIARLFTSSKDKNDLALASLGLEQIVEHPVETIDPLGRPVVALARVEHAQVALAEDRRTTYETRLGSLLRDVEANAGLLPCDAVAELATTAGSLLMAEKGEEWHAEARRAQAAAEARTRLEERAERIDEAMSADVRALLRGQRRGEASDGPQPAASRLYLKRGADVFVVAPIEREGALVALAFVPVDLDRFAAAVVARRVPASTSDEETVAFEVSRISPVLPDESEAGRRALGPPLETLEVVAQGRDAVEDGLSRKQTTMKLWLIALAVGGVAAGAIVTTRTVVREAKAAELKSDFVTNVTHELRTPLTSIRMFIETLELGRVENEAEAKECLGIMARETDRLTRLIERLLAFSKIESRKWRFKFSYVPPLDLVDEAIRVLRQQLQLKEGDPFPVEVEMVQDVAPVAVDRDAIIEVILNLLTNAWKYTPPSNRRIKIVVSERRKQVVIDVEDNGIGVPRRDRRRIWKKFERGSNAEKGRIEGSGIGLTLALSIARGHGGTVTLTPLKQGSRFSLVLPKLALAKGH